MRFVSVTRALSPYIDYSRIPDPVLAVACQRGQAVHTVCAGYAKKIWTPALAAEWQGYFKSFRGWFDEYVRSVVFVEKKFSDDTFGFTGRPDLGVVMMDGVRTIVDLKTPVQEGPTWKAQLGAYKHLANDHYKRQFERALSLRLRPNGGRALASVCEPGVDDFTAFTWALFCYRYFIKGEVKQ